MIMKRINEKVKIIHLLVNTGMNISMLSIQILRLHLMDDEDVKFDWPVLAILYSIITVINDR